MILVAHAGGREVLLPFLMRLVIDGSRVESAVQFSSFEYRWWRLEVEGCREILTIFSYDV